MSEGLTVVISDFERLHDKLFDGEYIYQYRKFCSDNNVNTLISEAKWACTIKGYPNDEELLRYTRNLNMSEAILKYSIIKQDSFTRSLFLHGA